MTINYPGHLHIDKLCKSYRKKLGALRRMPRLPPKVLEEIYFKTVVSGVSYCIPVWGGCTAPLFNKLEEIHTKAARLMHDLPRDQDNTHVLQKANWLPLSYMYKKAILKRQSMTLDNLNNWYWIHPKRK